MAGGVTERLAGFACGLRVEDLSDEALAAARLRILDTVGVGLAGSQTDHAGIVRELIRETGGRPVASVWGSGFKTDPISATLANGTSVHSIDSDDTHKFVHPGCSMVSAALALGQPRAVDGATFLAAVVAGYDVSTRVSLAVGLSHRRRGYHPTGTCNSLGSAAAAGRVLGLSQEQMINALGLAVSMASGVTQYRFDGNRSKHLHGGLAGRNGVLAALLASKGYSGAQQALEGEQAFFRVMADEHDASLALAGLGEVFEITRTDIKPYSSCRQTHAPVDLALELARGHDLKPAEIEQIVLTTYSYIPSCSWLIATGGCKTPLEAMLNIPYCLAAAIADRQLSLVQFGENKLVDPTINRLMRLVSFEEDPEMSRKFPTERNNELTIRLRDGRSVSARTINARGSKDRPLTEADVREKFRGLAAPVVGELTASRVEETAMGLERVVDVAVLAELLEGSA